MSMLRTRKGRRLAVVLLCLMGLGTASGLTLLAFSDNLVFFVTPGDLVDKPQPAGRMLRLGGLVSRAVRRAAVLLAKRCGTASRWRGFG